MRAAKTIHINPQAHIDLLWYRLLDETVRMVLHPFRGHTERLEQDRSLTYAQSQAWAYEIVRREDPEIFARIARLTRGRRWEVVGGGWCEADTVIPGADMVDHYRTGLWTGLARFNRDIKAVRRT